MSVCRAQDYPCSVELVQVPGGTFIMGSDSFANAQPAHEVTLSAFAIGKYEVTNRIYAEVLNYALAKGYLDKAFLAPDAKKREARGVSKSAQKYQDVFDEHSQITFTNGVFKAHPGKEDCPVVEVTWYGAAFFCNMLSEMAGLTPLYNLDNWSCQVYGASGYRLPTEAEWEYAAQFDDARAYPWGKAVPSGKLGNLNKSVKQPTDVLTMPVGSFPKGNSKLGICDLAGNAAEWCNDWYNDSYSGACALRDPVGPGPVLQFNLPVFKEFRAARVVRGGSFLIDLNYRKEMGRPFIMDTVMHKEVYNNRFRSYDYLSRQVIGFRVVKIEAATGAQQVFSPGEEQ